MFRLIEPSSGQFINHTEDTFSRCTHCGNPQCAHLVSLSIYKSGNMYRVIEPSTNQFINHIEGKFSRCAHCGILHCAHLLNLPSIWCMNWPDDGSITRNMFPDL